MENKRKFDIEAYEKIFVNNALEKRPSRKQLGSFKIDTPYVKAVKLSQAELQAQEKIDFLERE